MPEEHDLFIEPTPQISVFNNQGGNITIRIVAIDQDEKLSEEMISIPRQYAAQIGQALINLSSQD